MKNCGVNQRNQNCRRGYYIQSHCLCGEKKAFKEFSHQCLFVFLCEFSYETSATNGALARTNLAYVVTTLSKVALLFLNPLFALLNSLAMLQDVHSTVSILSQCM